MKATHQTRADAHQIQVTLRLIALIVLAAAFLGVLGMGLLVGCGSDATKDTQGVAPDDVKTMLQDWLAANNQGDEEALAALYSENAVVDDFVASPSTRTEGRASVVDMIAYWAGEGLAFTASGGPMLLGDYVVQTVIITGNGSPVGEAVQVFQINGDGKIVHQWVTGEIRAE